ncbi:hypothetical protein [Cylindrospermopsis raciborskii]|uniref:Uncharacterized protein n=1 Tax=Cylindrospermopsis raciborskii CS-506_A TaxID=2585140 RepID=A0A838WNG3_9CYAN|nr:hypothetical protein [Cylindrospermopsis raciborskii]MBA4446056.1 hypothetical protein [Cylindrospermopsis raciborskii CS-506_C]MBA4450285.1 hypothetical protein [Cylindrospermopsis raciborskii CS-506_D]MBA4456909.1 hypothetical protein [Cylindrospermopsis raciborskii CS-506_B]MBA4466265.1 hypothetical protein [Cylindrospermopsis raciborskii CS-506_A]
MRNEAQYNTMGDRITPNLLKVKFSMKSLVGQELLSGCIHSLPSLNFPTRNDRPIHPTLSLKDSHTL